ncbi:MAG: WD40 repeat domain-containing protein, partial [Pirellulaceae bacterium]|nr:WD40 repeat domain-containing protein [Pirellulaceae bacterium]
ALGSGNTSFRVPILRVSPGESMSLAGGRNGRYMISRSDRQQVPRPWSFDQAISDGHFSRQGHTILLSSYSGDVALMNSENGRLECAPLTHPAAVFSASMSSDNRYVATGSRDGNVRVWDTALAGREGEDFPQPFSLYGASYADDGRHFVLATAEHNVVAWRRQAPMLPAFSLDHQDQIGLVTYGPGNNRIVTATVKGAVHLWNATGGVSIADLTVDDKPSTKVLFSPDGKQLATTTTDHYLHLWNAQDGVRHHKIGPFPGPILEVAFHPATPLVSVVTRESTDPIRSLVHQRDTLTGKAVGAPLTIDGLVRSLAAHPDGQRILLRVSTPIGNEDHAQFWNLQDRTAPPVIIRQQNPLDATVMNSTGSLLLTSDLDGTARLWDSEGGNPVSPPLRHGSPITDMAFSHHGRYFATATDNGIVQLWSSASGTPLIPPIDVGSSIVGITFHPADEELMILMSRAIRFIDLGGSPLSPGDAGFLVSAIRGQRLSKDGGRAPMSSEETLVAGKLLKTTFPDLFTLSDQQSFTWHQLHGPDVPASFWTQRRDTLTDHLAQATQDYVRYSLFLQRARSHVELEDYEAALEDLSASHRHARPEFSTGSYSLPLFQRACLAAFLDRADIYTETFQAMINSVDPLNPVDAARMATAICLSASDHGPLPLSIQLAARSGPRNPTPRTGTPAPTG